jgi:hypothetical protein
MALMSWSTCAACVLGVGEYNTMQPAFELMVWSDAGFDEWWIDGFLKGFSDLKMLDFGFLERRKVCHRIVK